MSEQSDAPEPTSISADGVEAQPAQSADEIAKVVSALAPAIQAEIQRWNDAWAAVAKDLAPQLAEWNRLAKNLAGYIAPVIEAYSSTLKVVAPLVAEFTRRELEARKMDDAGWLPHYTTPFQLLAGPDLTPHDIDRVLTEHYSTNWAAVRARFLEKLDNYNVDDIAKSAFREALESHEAGRYRSAIVLLFIEIERLVRHEFHSGEVGGMASVPILREIAGSISAGDTEPGGIPGLWLFKKLGNHLYAPVKTDEQLAPYALSPVPNRHAAIHGLIVYSTAQSSLNTLFMADYIYQVVHAAKAASDIQVDATADSANGQLR